MEPAADSSRQEGTSGRKLVELAELAASGLNTSLDQSGSFQQFSQQPQQSARSTAPAQASDVNGGSTVMLRPKAMQAVLKEVVTSGVLGAMVLNHDGSLLSHCGTSEARSRIAAAISSNIFSAYHRTGQTSIGKETANLILIANEEGCVGIQRVASKLVCIYARKSVPLGMLKAKMQALVDFLSTPLTLL